MRRDIRRAVIVVIRRNISVMMVIVVVGVPIAVAVIPSVRR